MRSFPACPARSSARRARRRVLRCRSRVAHFREGALGVFWGVCALRLCHCLRIRLLEKETPRTRPAAVRSEDCGACLARKLTKDGWTDANGCVRIDDDEDDDGRGAYSEVFTS